MKATVTRKPASELTRENLLALLSAFINQRPGLEYANYVDASSYRAESRSITADGHDARALLAAVSWRGSIDARSIREALQGSSRLTLSDDGRLEYCTGQYFPTEYRPAVCRVLAGLLRNYWRENGPADNRFAVEWYADGKCQSRDFGVGINEAAAFAAEDAGRYVVGTVNGVRRGDVVRKQARCGLGQRIARHYFR